MICDHFALCPLLSGPINYMPLKALSQKMVTHKKTRILSCMNVSNVLLDAILKDCFGQLKH